MSVESERTVEFIDPKWENSGYGDFKDVFDPKYDHPYLMPIVIATDETLKGYGHIVTDYVKEEVKIVPWPVQGWRPLWEDTGIHGGVRSGEFVYKWVGDKCTAINKAVKDGDYITGILPNYVTPQNRTHVLIKDANYHPDGSQVFFPVSKDPFVAVLALPGDDVKPESFVAFYFDGSVGLHIHPNVWHQPMYPISDEAVFIGKQGAVHACVGVDTAKEFGKYLLVPLTKPSDYFKVGDE